MPPQRKATSVRRRSVVVDDIAKLCFPLLPTSPEKKIGLYRGEQSIAAKYPFNTEWKLVPCVAPSKRSFTAPVPSNQLDGDSNSSSSSASSSSPFKPSARPRTSSLKRSEAYLERRKNRDQLDIIFIRGPESSQLRLNAPTKPKAREERFALMASPKISYIFLPHSSRMTEAVEEKTSKTGMPNTISFGTDNVSYGTDAGCTLVQPDAVSNADPGIPDNRKDLPVIVCFEFAGYEDLGLDTSSSKVLLHPMRADEDFRTMRCRIISTIRKLYDQFLKKAHDTPKRERAFSETEDGYACDAAHFSANDVRVHSLTRIKDSVYSIQFIVPRATARNIFA